MSLVPEFVDTRTAAMLLGLSPKTLETKRCRGGGPPFVRLGPKCVKYELAALRLWMRERTIRSTSEPQRLAA